MPTKIIAIEEAFVTQAVADAWKDVLASPDCEPGFRMMGDSILAETPGNKMLHSRLIDIGAGRIAHMDEVGVDMQILSMTSPGVQVFETGLANALTIDANDQLAAAVKEYPTRFAALGAFAPQDPVQAAQEIYRMRTLGFVGAIVNSHTMGEYLDLPKFAPIMQALEAEKLPLYLHPREPSPSMVQPYLDYGLYFAGWGFAAETGLHAMRLIMSGAFDRYPGLKIILGHMGEGLPFWLQRIDNRYLLQVKIGAVKKLERLPSEYFLDNFVITTAGVTSQPALRLSIDVLGAERIMFAADYPYENDAEGVDFIRSCDISPQERDAICHGNAAALFGI